MENKNEQKLDIELSNEVAHGVFSNLQIITHSPNEFILDFVQMMPGTPKAQVRSRIIMTPQIAKSLLYSLKDNIDKYEQNNGIIEQRQQNNTMPYQINPLGQA